MWFLSLSFLLLDFENDNGFLFYRLSPLIIFKEARQIIWPNFAEFFSVCYHWPIFPASCRSYWFSRLDARFRMPIFRMSCHRSVDFTAVLHWLWKLPLLLWWRTFLCSKLTLFACQMLSRAWCHIPYFTFWDGRSFMFRLHYYSTHFSVACLNVLTHHVREHQTRCTLLAQLSSHICIGISWNLPSRCPQIP